MIMNNAIGVCPICEINIYESKEKGKPVQFRGRTIVGYPNPVSMPCGLNRDEGRCPFESKKEQDAIDLQKSVGIFSGENNWE
jgi:hypothetical protein